MVPLANHTIGTGPRLLLVHGLFDSSRSWAGVAPRLAAAGYTVTTVDLRGHGDSPKPASGYAPEDFAADLRPFLDPQTVYVGHSMGARIGWVVASSTPLRGLVIGDIGMEPQPEAWHGVQALVDGMPIGIHGVEGFVATLPEDERDYVRRCMLDGRFSRQAVVETVRHGRARDWIDLARHIDCPVLFVRAERSQEVSTGEAARVCAAIPCCRYMEIPDAAHDLHETHPERFAAAVLEWLSHLEENRDRGGTSKTHG
ncbi:MAG: alpha/beta fold hydrolase [Candidatus Xenobia bacterium]